MRPCSTPDFYPLFSVFYPPIFAFYPPVFAFYALVFAFWVPFFRASLVIHRNTYL